MNAIRNIQAWMRYRHSAVASSTIERAQRLGGGKTYVFPDVSFFVAGTGSTAPPQVMRPRGSGGNNPSAPLLQKDEKKLAKRPEIWKNHRR